jgi:hypothetical protein
MSFVMSKLVRVQAIPAKGPCVSGLKAAKARQASKISELRSILISSGYCTLQKQATALGLSRSTTWHLLGANHKASGLTGAIIRRILSSPTLPPAARDLIQEYVAEKLLGAYGHDRTPLRRFRRQLGYPEQPTLRAENKELP